MREFYVLYLMDTHTLTKEKKDFDNAILIRPDNLDALINRGIANQQLRRYKNALKDFDRVLELNPKSNKAFRFNCTQTYVYPSNRRSNKKDTHQDAPGA